MTDPILSSGQPACQANNPRTTGAVDLSACPSRWGSCRCAKCAVCGFRKHKAIHGPFHGQPAGSKPYGHEFIPANTEAVK